ncbi:MAG TPA: hypothetical protein VFJ78_03125 [Gaiellaceae bacterium]|nr:hypothetical protein [Gaiellaceae bacterium]
MWVSRRRSLAVSLTVCSALVAGCGSTGGPKLEHSDGAALIRLAHRIGGEPRPARARDIARLQARAIALVNARRVPTDLQEPLLSAVNALAAGRPQAARDLESWLRRYSR